VSPALCVIQTPICLRSWHVPRHLAVSDVSSRPYGRASYATMLRPSVCLSSVTYALWLSGDSKVLEQKLLLIAYIGSRI